MLSIHPVAVALSIKTVNIYGILNKMIKVPLSVNSLEITFFTFRIRKCTDMPFEKYERVNMLSRQIEPCVIVKLFLKREVKIRRIKYSAKRHAGSNPLIFFHRCAHR